MPIQKHLSSVIHMNRSAIDIQTTHLYLYQVPEPTPRPDRISKDYKEEYPSIEVESRTVLNKKKKEKKDEQSNNMENVKLDTEVKNIA